MNIRPKAVFLLLFVFCGGVSSRADAQCGRPAARIIRVANQVQYKLASSPAFAAATPNLEICEGDSVRAGERSRATIVFLENGVILTIEQNTEWVLRRSSNQGPSLIELVRGAILFLTHRARSLEV